MEHPWALWGTLKKKLQRERDAYTTPKRPQTTSVAVKTDMSMELVSLIKHLDEASTTCGMQISAGKTQLMTIVNHT